MHLKHKDVLEAAQKSTSDFKAAGCCISRMQFHVCTMHVTAHGLTSSSEKKPKLTASICAVVTSLLCRFDCAMLRPASSHKAARLCLKWHHGVIQKSIAAQSNIVPLFGSACAHWRHACQQYNIYWKIGTTHDFTGLKNANSSHRMNKTLQYMPQQQSSPRVSLRAKRLSYNLQGC